MSQPTVAATSQSLRRRCDNRPNSCRTIDLPPLSRDASFWGMAATQFLGAFNDNLFKQLILLLATPTAAAAAGRSPRPIAKSTAHECIRRRRS